jgi:ribose 5-phosphate isomerase RpiB
MNVMFLGGRATGHALSGDLFQTFLTPHFKEAERLERHLAKVAALEGK